MLKKRFKIEHVLSVCNVLYDAVLAFGEVAVPGGRAIATYSVILKMPEKTKTKKTNIFTSKRLAVE